MISDSSNVSESKLLDAKETKNNIDCTSFCPYPGYTHALLVGKYQLDTSTQKVNGGYSVYDCSKRKLDMVQETEETGIFDAKWLHVKHEGQPVFAAAYASPSFKLYSINEDLSKTNVISEDLLSDSAKNLYIDHLIKNDQHHFLVTDDRSKVNVIKKSSTLETLSKESYDCKHEFTIWCAQWLPGDENCFLTGADDAKLNMHDLRVGEDITVKQNKKGHQMGVCDINFDPKDPNLFITGSYDDNIRLWDIRKFQPISEMNLGGGVWRARFDPNGKELIGCATMYNNFQLLRVNAAGTFDIVYEFNEHKSLCYGMDIQPYDSASNAGQALTFATCSFYDNKLCLWEKQIE